jgi:glycosyltransferase involved in cell wall biosynthesis
MYGLDEKRCRSVLNGIDMKRFAEPRVQGCTNSFRLLSLGRLDDNKDVATLLDAVVLLSDIDITVTIAGDGPKRDALVERAETMGIMDRVKFVGHVEDVGGLYQEADCFVMPSRSEACPLALMEAMAAGLPSVTSDGGSLPYLNMDGITGRVFPVGNARECATAIAELAKNRQHAATMGAEAARRAARDFSVGRMTIAMTHIYADLSCGNIGANGIAR